MLNVTIIQYVMNITMGNSNVQAGVVKKKNKSDLYQLRSTRDVILACDPAIRHNVI